MFNSPPKRTVVASVLAVSMAVFVFASGNGPLSWSVGPRAQPTAPAPTAQATAQPTATPLPAPTTVTQTTASASQADVGVTREAAAGPDLGDDETTAATGNAAQPAASHAPRVGIQAGHWLSAELPDELARLRTSTGTAGGGVPEWQLNLDIARRLAKLLEARGIAVDVLPATIPAGYEADAFVALHADGDTTGTMSGFKLASGRWTNDPSADKALIDAITKDYGAETGLGIDPHISRNMTGYYAFSNRRLVHAVGAATPSAILEMGFMTNASDLRLLLGSPDTVAQGIADGITAFLQARHVIARP